MRRFPLPEGFRLDRLAAGAWSEGREVAWLENDGKPLVAFGAPIAVASDFEGLERLPLAVGYVGYEAGRHFERLPLTDDPLLGFPEMRWISPSHVVEGNPPELFTIGGARDEALRLEALGRTEISALELTVRPARTRESYLAAARRVKEHIAAGDVYQANLTQRFDAEECADPFSVHLELLARNPSPFAAFLGFGDRAIVSASPELFLRRRGLEVETRPIKGTRRRTGDARRDENARAELEASEKERAELAMIVDLERNDLSRVCVPGSVRVASAGETQTFATVFHRTAVVTGTLREGTSTLDLLRATFPGGSISGCPKIRAIEILAELEREPRGPGFGAIGRIGYGGDLDLNLAIRTLCFLRSGDRWRASFRTGGGIVADSDPEEEYVESLAKARALAEALGDARFFDTHAWTSRS